jgi:co-chaperonin GroES (HSP10)
MYLDPSTVVPTAGNVLVELVEVLGGMTMGGIFIPGTTQDHAGKDTFYGRVMKVGGPPQLRHIGHRSETRHNQSGKRWSKEYMDELFSEGDIVVFPRDVPLAFNWKDKRYCLCHIDEAIVAINADEFDAQGFEVVPWKPPKIS